MPLVPSSTNSRVLLYTLPDLKDSQMISFQDIPVYIFIFKRSNREVVSRISVFEHLVYSWWNYLERVGRWRCAIIGGGVSLGTEIGVPKPKPLPITALGLLLVDQDVISQLLL